MTSADRRPNPKRHAQGEEPKTQGLISDRTSENLAGSDAGVALLRRMMFENIERVKRGEDRLGVIRDPNRVFDTNLEESLKTKKYPLGIATETVSS